jgi:Uma2 family endonuclease
MEAVALKLPDEIEEDELVRLPASWDEYLAVVEHIGYTLQFFNGEVIGSQPDDIHETIVPNIAWLLSNLYANQNDYRVLSSNIKLAVQEGKIDFNADLSVLRKSVNYGFAPEGRPANAQIKNPEIVVEILSKSTRKFDLGEKLTEYKLIPSLQYILFVDQYRPFVSVYTRTTPVPDEWLNHDYRTLDAIVRFGPSELPMKDIYRSISFEA